MAIRFKCPNCKKTLGVKDHLAGRKALCPACRKSLVIPALQDAPADVEELAAKMLAGAPAAAPKPEPVDQPIKFHCDYCDAEIEKPQAEAGTKTPCPGCKRIIRIPTPKVVKPKDWRDIAKKGPSGALANQPEELENAWGSVQKKNVSASALSQAGAVEEEEAEPILLADWFKRGFWAVVILGVGTLAFFVISRARTDKMQNDTIEAALEMIENKPNQPAKIQLSPLWSAEIHRAAGEFYCRQRQVVKAREELQKALAYAVRADKKTFSVEIDLFLIELALTQIDLGGTEDEAIAKERLYWPETLKELTPSLEAISDPHARSLGLRNVVSRLVEKKQAKGAIDLAGWLSLIPQQSALLFAQDNDKDVAQAKKLLPYPQTDNKARTAFVEGFVRQGKCKEALDLASAENTVSDNIEAVHRLEAAVVAASVLTDHCRAKAAPGEALPFVNTALKSARDKNLQSSISPWILYQLIQAGLRTDAADEVKEFAKTLEPAFQEYIKLDMFRLKMAKTTQPLATLDDLIQNKESFVSALIYESLARQNSRLGQSRDNLMKLVQFAEDDKNRPFVLVGMAMGESERNK